MLEMWLLKNRTAWWCIQCSKTLVGYRKCDVDVTKLRQSAFALILWWRTIMFMYFMCIIHNQCSHLLRLCYTYLSFCSLISNLSLHLDKSETQRESDMMWRNRRKTETETQIEMQLKVIRQPSWSESKALSFLFHMQIKISKGICLLYFLFFICTGNNNIISHHPCWNSA